LEIYNEEIRDLLGKDRDRSLEVINDFLSKRQTIIEQIFRSKNDRMSVFMLMVYLHILAKVQQIWKL